MNRPLRLAVTPGEPGGIGPDLAISVAAPAGVELVLIADPALLSARAALLGRSLTLPSYAADQPRSGQLSVCAPALAVQDPAPGRADPANAGYVLACLDRAIQGCMDGEFDALLTGPVQKSSIVAAGHRFSGHTEYLAERAGDAVHPVMLLVSGARRVALACTHLPLAAVATYLNPERVERCLQVLDRDLRRHFAIERPRIGVLGLNPHAGDGGALGSEERDWIAPLVTRMRAAGMQLDGPLSADTAFVPQHWDRYDVILAMYHDQGLPVIKYVGFGGGVNVTLGLPFLRTSVDHGTALDIAGSGRADPGSYREALALAVSQASQLGARR